MEALRYVMCGRAECLRQFFLCSRCDRGQRYCSEPCRKRARRQSVREAGGRYQRTLDGRHAHAARQAAYRQRQQQKVTHQPPPVAAEEPKVSPTLEPPAMSAQLPSSAERPLPHAPEHSPTCAHCGRVSRYVRHTTLARFRPRWSQRPAAGGEP
ncbi:hypothetical protein [Hyalangium gracile]|uniref:hypothetical protein n=1 Tax=Hyalangium gracile TaxID=394092 RepID=UPI001CCBC406|nr:hypothetical protein [Hyalangium gracile]